MVFLKKEAQCKWQWLHIDAKNGSQYYSGLGHKPEWPRDDPNRPTWCLKKGVTL